MKPTRLVGLALLLALPACFAVTDLDRFEQPAAIAQGNYRDLKTTWSGMDNHVTEYVEFRIIDAANVIQTRGIFKPLGGPSQSFFVPMGVPTQNGPFRLDFWADHNKSGGYDYTAAGTADHSWRVALDSTLVDANGQYVVNFQHNYSFTDVSDPPATQIGQPVKLTLTDMTAFLGQRIEMRVADANSGHVAAFYRVPAIAKEVSLEVDGMIEAGSRYTVSLYLDNGSGGAVRGFTETLVAAEGGLTLTGGDPIGAGFAEVMDKNAIAAP